MKFQERHDDRAVRDDGAGNNRTPGLPELPAILKGSERRRSARARRHGRGESSSVTALSKHFLASAGAVLKGPLPVESTRRHGSRRNPVEGDERHRVGVDRSKREAVAFQGAGLPVRQMRVHGLVRAGPQAPLGTKALHTVFAVAVGRAGQLALAKGAFVRLRSFACDRVHGLYGAPTLAIEILVIAIPGLDRQRLGTRAGPPGRFFPVDRPVQGRQVDVMPRRGLLVHGAGQGGGLFRPRQLAHVVQRGLHIAGADFVR